MIQLNIQTDSTTTEAKVFEVQIDSTEFQLCVMTSTSSAITKTHKN